MCYLNERLQKYKNDKINIIDLLDDLPEDFDRRYELFIVDLISLDKVSKNEFKQFIDNTNVNFQ